MTPSPRTFYSFNKIPYPYGPFHITGDAACKLWSAILANIPLKQHRRVVAPSELITAIPPLFFSYTHSHIILPFGWWGAIGASRKYVNSIQLEGGRWFKNSTTVSFQFFFLAKYIEFVSQCLIYKTPYYALFITFRKNDILVTRSFEAKKRVFENDMSKWSSLWPAASSNDVSVRCKARNANIVVVTVNISNGLVTRAFQHVKDQGR